MIKTKIEIPYTGKFIIVSLDPDTLISPHFRLTELANNKGNKNIPQYEINTETGRFMANVETLRGMYGKPINLSSCYRQPAFNLSVGGSLNSLHTPTINHPGGLAIDWKLPALQDPLYNQIYKWWYTICYDTAHIPGINRYTNGVHLSYDERLLGYKEPQIRDKRKTTEDW